MAAEKKTTKKKPAAKRVAKKKPVAKKVVKKKNCSKETSCEENGYQGPILIIHGNRDKVVPVKHALEMNKRIPNAELILYDCGHSDCPPVWETYWKDITDFLNRVLSN